MPNNPSYRKIRLTRGKYALVDADNFDWLNQWKWQADFNKTSQKFYAVRTELHNGKNVKFRMHRQVMGLQKGDPTQVDHRKPEKTLDNRRSNLRTANASQQAFNKKKPRTNTSGYKGVHLDKKRGLYIAVMKVRGEFMYLGARPTAKRAYRELYVPAARIHQGEFALL